MGKEIESDLPPDESGLKKEDHIYRIRYMMSNFASNFAPDIEIEMTSVEFSKILSYSYEVCGIQKRDFSVCAKAEHDAEIHFGDYYDRQRTSK